MSNYYEKKDAKVNIAHALMDLGWEVFGYKANESDAMTDYYSPADWDGIASKNGYVLVVDNTGTYYSSYEKYKIEYDTNSSNKYDKIDKLKNMTIENGCTEEEAETAKLMLDKIEASIKENTIKEIICVYPSFQYGNPKGSIWHIEKEGKIIAKGRSLTPFASVPDGYMFDIQTETFKNEYRYIHRYNNELEEYETIERELKDYEKKAVKQFKTFLNKLESIVATKIGNGNDEELEMVIEEKITYKAEKVKIDRKNELQTGDIVYCNGKLCVIKEINEIRGIYAAIKISHKTFKESKAVDARINLSKKSFDAELQRGNLNVYKIEQVEHIEKIEKWVQKTSKYKTTKKNNAKVENDIDRCNDIKVNFNEEKKGIELYFSNKPSEEVRSNLKTNGFKWSKFNKCWYIKDTEKARTYLKETGYIEELQEDRREEISEKEIVDILKYAEEYKNQVLNEEIEERNNVYNMETLEDYEIVATGSEYYNITRKACDLNDLKDFQEIEKGIIKRIIKLSNNNFELFSNNLLTDIKFLERYGGTKYKHKIDDTKEYDSDYMYAHAEEFEMNEIYILICNEDETKYILSNPHGYSYSRYTGVLDMDKGKEILKHSKKIKGGTDNEEINNQDKIVV
ncbi:hypothetical protein M1I50_09670 [Clostridioides difficile]|nr:hypothetical protein [Clostridioides difficile]MCL0943251.1 hypothetical protein [Clostridioides difficile]MDI2845748.1 hypothetical protein [Clostridioides difficile]